METVEVSRWLIDLFMSGVGVLVLVLGYRISLKITKEKWYWWGVLVGGVLGMVIILVTLWLDT